MLRLGEIEKFIITFENCEWLHIQKEDMIYFRCSEPREFVNYSSHNGLRNSVSWGKMELSFHTNNPNKCRVMQYNDITSVRIVYFDGFPSDYHPSWSDKGDTDNSFQNSFIEGVDVVTVEILNK